MGKYDSGASRREQALCMHALETGDFDNMTDAEWLALCEQIAHDSPDGSVDLTKVSRATLEKVKTANGAEEDD